MCDLRWTRRVRRLLLQRVHHPRKGPGRLSENRQLGQLENGSVLRAEKVRFQEKVIRSGYRFLVHFVIFHFALQYFLHTCLVDNKIFIRTDFESQPSPHFVLDPVQVVGYFGVDSGSVGFAAAVTPRCESHDRAAFAGSGAGGANHSSARVSYEG